ncbi:MAG: glycosyltransferase family 1 protein [Anaerolineae bacterium]
MRIGIDARLIFYQKAGIGQYIMRLTEALAQLDHQDEFTFFTSRKDRTELVTQPNFRHRRLWTPSHHRFERATLSAEFLPFNLDVLHSPDFIQPSRTRFPSVITVHDLAFLLYPRFLTKESARYYGQVDVATRRARQVIAVSQSTKRDIIRLLGVPEERVTVIYEAAHPIFRPLDRAQARRHVAERYGIQEDFVLFVSTIEPRKNLPTLLEAIRKLRDIYHVPATLAVAGQQGWLVDQMNEIVTRLHLTEFVRFLGPVSNEELLYLYNAARVFALPSFYEGFGLPPLEAMACGTPVVVSNTSSFPEVVGDAGQLVPPEDVEAWSVALWRVLTDQNLRDEMCEKGLRRTAMFSWERAAREHLAVYYQAATK